MAGSENALFKTGLIFGKLFTLVEMVRDKKMNGQETDGLKSDYSLMLMTELVEVIAAVPYLSDTADEIESVIEDLMDKYPNQVDNTNIEQKGHFITNIKRKFSKLGKKKLKLEELDLLYTKLQIWEDRIKHAT